MNRDIRLYLLAVGIPALVLTLIGARFVYIEWKLESRPPEPQERQFDRPPPEAPDGPMDSGHPPENFEPGWDEPDDEPPDVMPPPENFMALFTERSDRDGIRDLWVGVCLFGLMFLSLVSGGWLVVKAARRSRLEAMRQTDFLSNISHEFKTPLTTICLCAELAKDDGLDAERRKKALDAVMTESERLKRLVLNALDFCRLEKNRRRYNLQRVDIAEIVREACATFAPRFSDGRLESPRGKCFATADADALREIMVNLIDNAAKYAPDGKVEVKVESVDGKVRVSVSDEGPGLTTDELQHAFDRFWRGDNSITRETGGSGLGLAIARGLARGMGGELTASNRQGGGAVFTLELYL